MNLTSRTNLASTRATLLAASLFLSAIPFVNAAPEDPSDSPPPAGAAQPSPGPGVKLPRPDGEHHHDRDKDRESVTELLAIITPVSSSNVKGSALFEQVGPEVKVTIKVGGLTPNSEHAVHIHEFGDISSADGSGAGGHFNPEGHPHGLPDAKTDMRHPGDFGNLKADADGNAVLTLTVQGISLGHGKNSIVGRAVVIHAKPDDGSQPTGNAGDRIGVGVIGVSKVAKMP